MSTQTIGIKSELAEVKVIAEHFQTFCAINYIDKKTTDLLELALVEAVNNIIIHAYDGKPGFDIQSEYEMTDTHLVITLTDEGKAFNNNTDNQNKVSSEKSKENDQKNTELKNLSEGNWGLDLINALADEIIRQRTQGRNSLIIKKKM